MATPQSNRGPSSTVGKPGNNSPAAKPTRDKSAKFVELATKRMNKTLKAIEGVSALSNRSSYTYSPDQSGKIVAALEAAVKELANRFAKGSDKAAGGFSL